MVANSDAPERDRRRIEDNCTEKQRRKQRSIKLATFVEHGWYLQSCRLATGRALTKEMTRKNTDALPRRERTGMEIPGASRVVDISAGSDSV